MEVLEPALIEVCYNRRAMGRLIEDWDTLNFREKVIIILALPLVFIGAKLSRFFPDIPA